MTMPQFTRPGRPDFGPLDQIHRRHDGYVSFAQIDEWGEWSEPFSIPAKELGEYRFLPSLMPVLLCDSFFTVNGQKWASKEVSRYDGLRRGRHSGKNTQYLTSCWADIDCYKLDMEVGTVIGEIINAERAERIPRVSMIMNSGGGVWLFWFICDRRDRDQPLRAYPPSIVNMWAATQRTIFEKFAKYGADPKSLDLSHHTRIPGGINTKWQTIVEYWLHLDENGTPFTYTLPDLVEWFGVFTKELPAAKSKRVRNRLSRAPDRGTSSPKNPIKQKAGRKGQRRRWEIDLEDFMVLWNMRGTFPPGQRNEAVRLLVKFMRGSRDFEPDQIWQKAHELYSGFEQPPGRKYTRKQLAATVNSTFKRNAVIKRQTVCDLLDVTPDEAGVLQAWTPAARFHDDQAPVLDNLTRKKERQVRRGAIRQIIDQLDGIVPKIHDLMRILRDDHGVEVGSTGTIYRDLKAMKIKNPRRHRKQKVSDEPLLF